MNYPYRKTFMASTHDDADIPTTRYPFNRYLGKHEAGYKANRFIKGPIPFSWFQAANALPGKAGAVGLALWFLKGVKRSSTFALTAEVQSLAGCGRQATYRALSVLHEAELIALTRRTGARPIVTICSEGHEIAADSSCADGFTREKGRLA